MIRTCRIMVLLLVLLATLTTAMALSYSSPPPADDAPPAPMPQEARPVNSAINKNRPQPLALPDKVQAPFDESLQYYVVQLPERMPLELAFVFSAPTKMRGRLIIAASDEPENKLYSYEFTDDRAPQFHFYPVLEPGSYRIVVECYENPSGSYQLGIQQHDAVFREADRRAAVASVDKAANWLLKNPLADEGEDRLIPKTALVMAALAESKAGDKEAELANKKYLKRLEEAFQQVDEINWSGLPIATPADGDIYEHAVATLCLAEAAELGHQRARPLARQAAAYLLAAQLSRQRPRQWGKPVDEKSPFHGGWRYSPASTNSDISATGWCFIALVAADAANIELPGMRPALEQALANVQRCYDDGRKTFTYMPNAADHRSDIRNSIGALTLLLMGEDDDKLDGALRHLDAHLPAGTQLDNGEDYLFYYWYYGTRVNYLRGGRAWDTWRTAMVRQLLRRQRPDGSFVSYDSERDLGNHYSTPLGLMIMRMCLDQVPAYLRREARGF